MHVSKFSSDLSDLSFTIGDLCSVKSFIAFTTVIKSYGQTYDLWVRFDFTNSYEANQITLQKNYYWNNVGEFASP